MLKLIIGVGGGVGLTQNAVIGVNMSNYKLTHYCVYWLSSENRGNGVLVSANMLSLYRRRIVFRMGSNITETASNSRIVCALFGNFNYDSVSIMDSTVFTGRIEIRNENDVLITDNGKPWGDGTYPPDAKNRAGLAGLHAAPVASTDEFTDLSELDPNKEEEITEAERDVGIEYALERNDDNGL